MLKKIGLLLLFIFIVVSNGLAQVQVTVPDTTAKSGLEVTIPVRVSNCSNYEIFSYQFTLTYNSAVLTPVRLETANTVTSSWPTPVMNNSTAGVLEIGGYGSNKIVGGGSLVKIVFQVIGNPNQVSNLNLSYFEFNDGNPGAIIENGSITVTMTALAVTITTNVPGNTQVIVDGTPFTAPHVAYWESGTQHEISAASVQTLGTDRRYLYQSWSDGGGQTHTITVTQSTTITATYSTQYYLTVQSTYGNPQGSGWYNAGAIAYFSVESEILSDATTKRRFASWSGSGSGSYSGALREANVTMNAAIVETANWTTSYLVQISSVHGTPYGAGWYNAGTVVSFGIDSTQINRWNAHSQFSSWAGTGTISYSGTSPQSTVTVNSPITEVAQWNDEFLVQTGSSPQGILTVPGAGWYPKGYPFTTISAPVTINKDGTAYEFKGWLVNDQVVSGNPITQAVTLPMTIIADYSQDITVTITTSVGVGTKVLVDGAEKSAPHTASWTAGSSHSIGVASEQNGIPGTRYSYIQWQHGGSQVQTVSPTTNLNYVANLKTEFFLDVSTDPADILTLTGEGWYEANEVVELDSAPASFKSGQSSYRLLHWLEDGVVRSENPISIVMNEPHTAVAKFQSGYYISGTITFVGASPAPVTINVSGMENFTLQTKADGTYLIGGLLAGNYQLTLLHPNFRFEPAIRTYQISKNEEYQYYVAFYVSAVVSDDRSGGATPDNFYLGQNYPNPFSDLTHIDYHLKNTEHVTISIYNIRGQLVNRLIDQQQPGGLYRILWDRTDFRGIVAPAGVYYYRIDAGDFMDKKSMIIF